LELLYLLYWCLYLLYWCPLQIHHHNLRVSLLRLTDLFLCGPVLRLTGDLLKVVDQEQQALKRFFLVLGKQNMVLAVLQLTVVLRRPVNLLYLTVVLRRFLLGLGN
jgi:hypothetical protein